MAGHTSHGVFIRLVGCLTREDVHLWIIGYHALVHAVEGKFLTIGTPESAFVDTKLIAMDRLTIDYLTRTVT